MPNTIEELETAILSYYFTNNDSNVYCATDNMPISIWGLLLGGYSRSGLSLRDRFLKVLKDLAKEESIEYYQLLLSFTNDLPATNNYIAKIMEKANKFMAKWSIEYGHNSLKDSAFNMMAIEGVSIRASKFIEESKLAAFQEKSTRYMDFSGDSYILIDKAIDELSAKAMQVYSEAKSRLIEYYKEIIPESDFKNQNAWIRTCSAKAFDDARYLLPTTIKTSLGATMSTRETERWISKLLTSEFPEVVEIGEKLKIECGKITAALINHVEKNTFLNRRLGALAKKICSTEIKELPLNESKPGVYLNSASNIELEVAYSLINATGLFDSNVLVDTSLGLDEVFNLAFEERGIHDDFPDECAVGMIQFEVICDIGAFRDLQRHRNCTQIVEKWSSLRGYSIPESLNDYKLSDIKEKYISLFEEYSKLNSKLIKDKNNNSEYALLLGHNVRFILECNFKELAYIIELRSGEAGHYSYRRLAQAMYKLFDNNFKSLSKHIRVNLNEYSDRRKQEEIIQSKIEANSNN